MAEAASSTPGLSIVAKSRGDSAEDTDFGSEDDFAAAFAEIAERSSIHDTVRSTLVAAASDVASTPVVGGERQGDGDKSEIFDPFG